VSDGKTQTERDDRTRSTRIVRMLVDGLLLVAVVGLGYLIAASAVAGANSKRELRLLSNEARLVYEAFDRYHERHHSYPSTYTAARFDPQTLNPLRKRGYYTGPITGYLLDRRVDAYDSPDDRGPDREFWLEMTLRSDPSIRVLVASSDDAPLGGGAWLDGAYLFRDGEIEPL
jgi:hypothetical protein